LPGTTSCTVSCSPPFGCTCAPSTLLTLPLEGSACLVPLKGCLRAKTWLHETMSLAVPCLLGSSDCDVLVGSNGCWLGWFVFVPVFLVDVLRAGMQLSSSTSTSTARLSFVSPLWAPPPLFPVCFLRSHPPCRLFLVGASQPPQTRRQRQSCTRRRAEPEVKAGAEWPIDQPFPERQNATALHFPCFPRAGMANATALFPAHSSFLLLKRPPHFSPFSLTAFRPSCRALEKEPEIAGPSLCFPLQQVLRLAGD